MPWSGHSSRPGLVSRTGSSPCVRFGLARRPRARLRAAGRWRLPSTAHGTPHAGSARRRCGRDTRSRPTAPARPSARPWRRRLVLAAAAWLVRSGSSRCHSSRALAAVKPEPQWPTGTSRLPAYSPSTSAPTRLLVDGRRHEARDHEAVALARLHLEPALHPARAVGRRRLLGDDAFEARGGWHA